MTRSEVEARIEREKQLELDRENNRLFWEIIKNIIILFWQLTLFIIIFLVALLKTSTGKAVLEFLKNYLIMVLLGLRVLLLFPFLFLQSIYLEKFKKNSK